MICVIVCGGRDYVVSADDCSDLGWIIENCGVTTLRHGGCRGADQGASDFVTAARPDVKVIKHPADWAKHGRSAGAIRNREMLDAATSAHDKVAVLAFPGGPGTANMIGLARSRGIHVIRIGRWP